MAKNFQGFRQMDDNLRNTKNFLSSKVFEKKFPTKQSSKIVPS